MPSGHLYYWHAAAGIAQWAAPPELRGVLGDWREAVDGQGQAYWVNDHLGTSSWSNPQATVSLHQAAEEGNVFFMQLYGLAGGSLDARDEQGRTALHVAAACGGAYFASLLLQSGAGADQLDCDGLTALHWACRHGHTAVARTLLEAGADPAAESAFGDSPLHEAAGCGSLEVVSLLLLAGGDPLQRNREWRTPADVAARRSCPEIAALLRRRARRESSRMHFRYDRYDSSEEEYEAAAATSWSRRGAAAQPQFQTPPHSPRSAAPPPPPTSPASPASPSSPLVLPAGDLGGARRRGLSPRAAAGGLPQAERDLARVMHRALGVVRAARPLLRSVQWLATAVFGEVDETPDRFFSEESGRWEAQAAAGGRDGRGRGRSPRAAAALRSLSPRALLRTGPASSATFGEAANMREASACLP